MPTVLKIKDYRFFFFSREELRRHILETEITNISGNGMWILTEGKEFFMPFETFPWFRDASVAKIANVETYANGHLYWPDLDIDLTVDIIEHPERFPLIAS